MTTYCTTPIATPLQEVSAAMGAVSESVQLFANAYIARAKKQSLEPGAARKAEAAQLKVRLQNFCKSVNDELVRADPMQKQQIIEQIVARVPVWVRLFDELLLSFEELEGTLALAPRETRRKHAEWAQRLRSANTDTHAMREMLLDLLEQVDPTPDDYLESEVRARHGNDADRLMQGFEALATSDAFTLDAFKKRHNLR